MRYGAVITKDGRELLATFPGCDGLVTGGSPEEIEHLAKDALVGWLKAHLDLGNVPPFPPRSVKGRRVLWVTVPAVLATKIALRRARIAQGLTQAELAGRTGVKQPVIARLENPDHDVKVGTLEKIAEVLGVELTVGFAKRRAA